MNAIERLTSAHPARTPADQARRPPPLAALLVVCAQAMVACGEDEQLFNVFEPPPPVVEVPCAGAESSSPWVAQPVPVEEGLGDIFGTGPDDLWIVGGNGTILRLDGGRFDDVSPSIGVDLLAIHGVAPDDLWTVGRAGVAAHWDGTAWHLVESGTTEVLVGVFALARDDVWFIGDEGVRHWDGTRIHTEAGWPTTPVNGIWASGPTDVRLVGDAETHHFDGTRFSTTPIQSGGTLAAIWGTDATHVFTIGHNSMNRPGFAELRGDAWLFSAAPPRAVYFSLWAESPERLWAGAADGTIFSREDGVWCREVLLGIGAINAFWGESERDLWAVGALRDTDATPRPVLLRRTQ